jgi:hypothetical protein
MHCTVPGRVAGVALTVSVAPLRISMISACA